MEICRRILDDINFRPSETQTALLILGANQEISDLELVEAFLTDERLCSKNPNSRTTPQAEARVQDAALAAACCLRGLDPEKLGFPALVRNDRYLFVPHSVGFTDTEQRKKAMQKYAEMTKEATPEP
jgi:hypothetical protein